MQKNWRKWLSIERETTDPSLNVTATNSQALQHVSESNTVSSSSILSKWKSYVSINNNNNNNNNNSANEEEERDLESSLPESVAPFIKSAGRSLAGTFEIVSKGVRELPGNVQSAANYLPSGQALMFFGLFLGIGIIFLLIAIFLFLPLIVIMPHKFAISFTLGCLFSMASLFALNGPKNQLNHMLVKERIPLTVGFVGSMVATIYVSSVLHSYIFSVIFSVIQVIALLYYIISYFPGGLTGLNFVFSKVGSSIMSRFGQ